MLLFRKSYPVKCFSVKSEIFNWNHGHEVRQEEKREVLRSSPSRSRSDIGQNLSSSPGSPPAHPTRDTPISRHRRRRSSQFHCQNAGCRTHFPTRGLRDSHMRRNCQFGAAQVKVLLRHIIQSMRISFHQFFAFYCWWKYCLVSMPCLSRFLTSVPLMMQCCKPWP